MTYSVSVATAASSFVEILIAASIAVVRIAVVVVVFDVAAVAASAHLVLDQPLLSKKCYGHLINFQANKGNQYFKYLENNYS